MLVLNTIRWPSPVCQMTSPLVAIPGLIDQTLKAPNVDFNLHPEPEPCQNQCLPKDLVNDPTNPFTFFFIPPFVNFGTPRSFHICICNFNMKTNISGVFHELSVELGIRHSAGLCVTGPQITFETSHSTWVTPEFKSIPG